ncbi:uncharacterized protein LOC123526574 isoform X1 [Mercenaria mercenaria]|uniref:uncharacterized protein LOC123526574 isoform X1 n=1 Tax=Mercenaria mercenaria TaxID=6596 RepID=UPI00234F6775|nr:uncharacterized protein LOC123526574 isoform X1 [Mercenaria mercenaria]
MTGKTVKPTIERWATMDSADIEEPELAKLNSDYPRKLRKSISMDSGENFSSSGNSSIYSVKRRYVRRRTIKRSGRLELNFGHDSEAYEKIRERVLKEHAVTNAIDALKERWRMITFKYNDCVERNEQRIERKLRTLCIQRQFDLIIVVFLFVLICLPICYGLSCII